MKRFFYAAPVAVVCAITSAAPGWGQARKASYEAGTVIPVALDRELNSKTNHTGDKFTVRVTADKDGYTALPEGSVIEGVLREARAKEGDQPGMLDLSFQRVRLANGRAYAISGSVIGLDDKNIEKNSDGVLVAKGKSKNNRLTYLGYGAGAGLLASVIGGGGKIRLENVLLGAGIGYLAGSLEKNKKQPSDVTLKENSALGVRLDRPLTLTSYASNDSSNTSGSGGNRLDRSRSGQGNSDRANRIPRPKADTGLNQTDGIGVIVNNEDVAFSSNAVPLTFNGIIFVPVRPVTQALNAELRTPSSGTLEVVLASSRVRISTGSRIAVVNGSRRVRLEAAARKLNGTTYVPASFFDLLTGTKHEWDSQSRTVVLSTNAQNN